MRKYLFLIALLIFPVFSTGLFFARELEVAVTECHGSVYYRNDAQSSWEALAVGDRLRVGAEIRIPVFSSAELMLENVFVQLNPGTYLVIKSLAQRGKAFRVEVELASGGIWSKVVQVVNNLLNYEVITPTAVAGVEGTVFSMDCLPEETGILVAEGLVKVRDRAGREIVLKAGEKAKVSPEGIMRMEIKDQDREDMERMNRWGREKESEFTRIKAQTGQTKAANKNGQGEQEGGTGKQGSNGGQGGQGGPK